LVVVFKRVNRKVKAVSTSEKQSGLYYISATFQTVLWRHFFSATASNKRLARLFHSKVL